MIYTQALFECVYYKERKIRRADEIIFAGDLVGDLASAAVPLAQGVGIVVNTAAGAVQTIVSALPLVGQATKPLTSLPPPSSDYTVTIAGMKFIHDQLANIDISTNLPLLHAYKLALARVCFSSLTYGTNTPTPPATGAGAQNAAPQANK